MRRLQSLMFASAVLCGAALLAFLPLTVAAHESRDIADGRYTIVVGFMDEPVFAGDKSGLEFWVSDASAATPGAGEDAEGAPVAGLEETLQAEVIFGDQTLTLALSPAFGEPGKYESVFFPMQPGDYTFRIFGTIGDTEIDETFTSGPETFGPIEDPEPLRFPPAG